ncbi:unnamed protein product [Gordionus sp. m RMFG-2023]
MDHNEEEVSYWLTTKFGMMKIDRSEFLEQGGEDIPNSINSNQKNISHDIIFEEVLETLPEISARGQGEIIEQENNTNIKKQKSFNKFLEDREGTIPHLDFKESAKLGDTVKTKSLRKNFSENSLKSGFVSGHGKMKQNSVIDIKPNKLAKIN